ncbi:hypothetical protein ACHAXM_006528 [Skeletonema potamos]
MGCPDTSSTDAVAVEVADIPRFYPIGTPGKPWSDTERIQWKATRKIHRSYKEEVLGKLDQIKLNNSDTLEIIQYGALSHDPERYPLFAVKSKRWSDEKSTVLVTGGVHGYETSGVQGALLFLETQAAKYTDQVNILVAPCISPWAYEHIERWNADLKDPNRSFKKGNETEESAALISYLESLDVKDWACHLDLHETTNSDKTEFRPAKAAEAGSMYKDGIIPDGFYLVGDSEDPQLDFLQAIISGVEKVTHIAPERVICDETVVKEGIILFPTKSLGLCGSLSLGLCRGITGGKYATTTEVYPDSPKATGAICNEAQVAAVIAALDFVLATQPTEIPRFYPIGTPGKPWSDMERIQWKESRRKHRSYKEEVLGKLDQIKLNNSNTLEVIQYGALSHDPERYPLFAVLESLDVKDWACHLDLHETTDTDELEFMPAKHAEAGLAYAGEVIPDGFYLVGDSENPNLEFHQAIISGVEKVTHIVKDESIIDEPAVSDGIILVPVTSLGLCGSITGGKCPATTTEVYPDSPKATGAICNHAQVAAIVSGIDFVLHH